MQLIRGTLTGSTLIAALAIGGLAQADDDHPPAPPKPYHAEHAGEHQASPHGSVSRERTMEMQRSLAARNLYQGKVDGVWGPKTESALRNFQTQNGLEATGRLDAPSAVALGMEADKQTVSGTDTSQAGPQSGTVVRQTQPQVEDSSTNVQLNTLTPEQGKEMQQRLQLLGYYRGEVDGVVGEGTRAALQRFFQRQADLASKGVISNAAIGLFGTQPADVAPVKGNDAKP
jgi:peptidoglycan hydrolase-like protein with peptidoglycan-binding domain